MKTAKADIVREYGPFPGIETIGGVTFDGQRVWFASGENLNALDPESGELVQALDVNAHAGTAFDGRYLYQIAEERILKIDPHSGAVLSAIPAPGHGADSGLAWAEGMLWVGQHRARQIHQIDPESGAIVHTITSDRFVTGVTWIDGELWHGTWEGEQSELRHVDAASGAVLERVELPAETFVSGLESNGNDQFYCGGGHSGKVRAIRKPGGSAQQNPKDSRGIADHQAGDGADGKAGRD